MKKVLVWHFPGRKRPRKEAKANVNMEVSMLRRGADMAGSSRCALVRNDPDAASAPRSLKFLFVHEPSGHHHLPPVDNLAVSRYFTQHDRQESVKDPLR